MKNVIFLGLLILGMVSSLPVGVAEGAERITDDTTVMENESQIMASENMTVIHEMVTLGDKERVAFIRMSTPEIAFELVMEFIYRPYETADGKWGYPCVGVEKYLLRK